MITRYKQGNCIRIEATIKDADGDAFDPDSVAVSVSSNGTDYVDEAAMTKSATGSYYYDWQTDTDDPAGIYDVEIKSVSGAKTAIAENKTMFEIYT